MPLYTVFNLDLNSVGLTSPSTNCPKLSANTSGFIPNVLNESLYDSNTAPYSASDNLTEPSALVLPG
jgi:hypothetical protein